MILIQKQNVARIALRRDPGAPPGTARVQRLGIHHDEQLRPSGPSIIMVSVLLPAAAD